jgi:cation diffusion facilitator family transporter
VIERARERIRRITRVLWAILVLNLIVALAKIFYGLASGAVALLADGIHSLLDASGNVVALIGISAARRPPDANHPYGHRKFETFAALGVAGLLFLGCYEIAQSAWERLRHPRPLELTPAILVTLLLTLAINVFVVLYERRQGRRLQSELLLADAAHTRSDVFATLLVLTSFAATRFRIPHADLAAAGVIVLLILRAGFEIVKGTISTLSDERRIPPGEVEAVALAAPGVLEVHNVRSRGPDDDIHVDLHILVDPALPIAAAHEIGHVVEKRLRERWQGLSDVVVHVEPGLESERARVREDGGLRADV